MSAKSAPPAGGKGRRRKKNRGKGKGKGVVKSVAAAYGRVRTGGNPTIVGNPYQPGGSCTIKHREYIGEIAGSVAFTVTQYSINPALQAMFNWLAPVAAQFEEYRFKKLCFDYETQTGTDIVGTVMMAVDFDAADDAPLNKQQLMAYKDAVRGPVWMDFSYVCQPSSLFRSRNLYTRTGTLASNLDVKTYDVGNLWFASQGEAGVDAVGELYVDYEIELKIPQISNLGVSQSKKIVGAVSISEAAFMGTTPILTGPLNLTATGNTITFGQGGEFLISCSNVGTTFIDGTPAITLGGNAVSTQIIAQMHNTAGTTSTFTLAVRITEPGETVAIDFAALGATLTGSTTWITAYPYALI